MLVDCRVAESVLPLDEIAAVSDMFKDVHEDYQEMAKSEIIFTFLKNE